MTFGGCLYFKQGETRISSHADHAASQLLGNLNRSEFRNDVRHTLLLIRIVARQTSEATKFDPQLLP